jgi:hypothetical protein
LTDEIFKSARDISFTPHRVYGIKEALASAEELQHFGTAMTKKSYIKGWGIRKVGVGGNDLIKTTNISSRETAFVMFSHR